MAFTLPEGYLRPLSIGSSELSLRRLALLLALATACASSSPAVRPDDAPPVQPPPGSLAAALLREQPPLPKRRVSPPGGAFSGEVEASGDITYEATERFTILTVPIGTASGLICFVYDEALDTGSSLLGVAKALAEDTTVQRMLPTAVLEAEGAPAVFMQVNYTTQSESGEPAGGQVKLMLHATAERPVLCAHDEPGYEQAFRRITLGLSRSLPRKPVPTRYSELQVMSLGEYPAGFEWRQVKDAEGGLRLIETTTSLLLPNKERTLTVVDASSTVLTDVSGRVQEYSYARSENGQLVIQLAGQREEATYRYVGTQDGRPVQGSFTPKGALTTALGAHTALREWLAGKEAQLTLELLEPWVNPGEASQGVFRRDERTGPRAITVTMDGQALQARLDAEGRLEAQQLPLGEGEFWLKRLSVTGAP